MSLAPPGTHRGVTTAADSLVLQLRTALAIAEAELAVLRPALARIAKLEQANAELELANAALTKDNAELTAQNTKLSRAKEKLKVQASLNSDNSSKPPSSDALQKKPPRPNSRVQSGKTSGGQFGHDGVNLPWDPHPKHIVDLGPTSCTCGCDVSGVATQQSAARQVRELPVAPAVEVTEYRVHSGTCNQCGAKVSGSFPDEVKGPVSYGPRVSAWIVFLACEQYIPLERLTVVMRTLFGIKLSQGTLVNKLHVFAQRVKVPVETILSCLGEEALLHADESGMRAEGKLHWLHVVATKLLTYYSLQTKRGTDAIDAIGLIPLFKGLLVHDFWKPYFQYPDLIHCICVAHLLRELKLADEQGQSWATPMITLLVEAHTAAKAARAAGQERLEPALLASFLARYQAILEQGRRDNQLPEFGPVAAGKRGAPQSKSVNLLVRFQNYQTEIFRFATDLKVPFDNNQAERDIRMIKTKQKISGTFRSLKTGIAFCVAKSYLSTAKKHAQDIGQAIYDAFRCSPFMPPRSRGATSAT